VVAIKSCRSGRNGLVSGHGFSRAEGREVREGL
jgi:hypothetical protein